MELDVYIPSLKTALEYQGLQHFKPVGFFGGEETFLEQVKRDKMKKEICTKNGIELIEVYYDEDLTAELLSRKIELAGSDIKQKPSK
jgi:hypothetical protein